ncbi:hypothetical protein BCR42DRAFT_408113 [Absidia repens]|uniref:Uncharacterized protein n=1 Tax=Absidia repens TaxID=90262 RepID=A0A1X2IT18_9FUNG|nr:hypothetical protein BCR42DRAFT_408113 [Absidia repens]
MPSASVYIFLAASAVLIIGVIILMLHWHKKQNAVKARTSNSSTHRLTRPLPYLPLPLQHRTHSTIDMLPTNNNSQAHRPSSSPPPTRPINYRALPSFRSDYVAIPPPTYDERKNDTLLPDTN